MRVPAIFVRTSSALALAAICLAVSVSANAPLSPPQPTKLFPADLGRFHLVDATQTPTDKDSDKPGSDGPRLMAHGDYTLSDAPNGPALRVSLNQWDNDSAAYAALTNSRLDSERDVPLTSDIGTASLVTEKAVSFVRGSILVNIVFTPDRRDQALELARLMAPTLDAGEDEVPVLVKHLPNWAAAQSHALYAVSSSQLLHALPNQPVLNEISFDGGAEAIVANYGESKLAIVEFTTPQMSIDNDSRIWTKIAELKAQSQSTPRAYRRVGNYSVFVFNAPDDQTANALIDQVKYEQVVQWLGDDPHLYDRLQRYLTQTSADVLVAVVKSSGLSLVACLAIGGLVGALLFRRRRTQRAAAFSDAGGSVRLNLDDLTEPRQTHKLLPASKKPRDD
jgi:uncharacterized protein DUF6599